VPNDDYGATGHIVEDRGNVAGVVPGSPRQRRFRRHSEARQVEGNGVEAVEDAVEVMVVTTPAV
jgi:hypothetical protein